MPLRFLIICLLLTRAMLGWTCGPAHNADLRPDGGCCTTTCCEAAGPCDAEIDSLACILCSACDGRVPPLPPANDRPIIAQHDWMAALSSTVGVDPGPAALEVLPNEITNAQVPRGVAWIERIRPLVCIWTI